MRCSSSSESHLNGILHGLPGLTVTVFRHVQFLYAYSGVFPPGFSPGSILSRTPCSTDIQHCPIIITQTQETHKKYLSKK